MNNNLLDIIITEYNNNNVELKNSLKLTNLTFLPWESRHEF